MVKFGFHPVSHDILGGQAVRAGGGGLSRNPAHHMFSDKHVDASDGEQTGSDQVSRAGIDMLTLLGCDSYMLLPTAAHQSRKPMTEKMHHVTCLLAL